MKRGIISICIFMLLAQCFCSGVIIRSNEFDTQKRINANMSTRLVCMVAPFRGGEEISKDNGKAPPGTKQKTHLDILQEEFSKRNINSVIVENDGGNTDCTDTLIFKFIEVKDYYRNIHGASTLSLLTLYIIPDYTKYKVAEIEFTSQKGAVKVKNYSLVIDWLLLLPVTLFNKLFSPNLVITDNTYIWEKFAEYYVNL